MPWDSMCVYCYNELTIVQHKIALIVAKKLHEFIFILMKDYSYYHVQK